MCVSSTKNQSVFKSNNSHSYIGSLIPRYFAANLLAIELTDVIVRIEEIFAVLGVDLTTLFPFEFGIKITKLIFEAIFEMSILLRPFFRNNCIDEIFVRT